MDRVTRLMIIVTCLLVSLSCVRSWLGNASSVLASGPVTYQTRFWNDRDMDMGAAKYDQLLNSMGKEGWHLVAVPGVAHPYLVFEK